MTNQHCQCHTDAARYRCRYAIPGTMDCDKTCNSYEKEASHTDYNHTEDRGMELLRHHAKALYKTQKEFCQTSTPIPPMAMRIAVALSFVLLTIAMLPWFAWQLIKQPDGPVEYPYID